MQRLHNELASLGPQGHARMQREVRRGQLHVVVKTQAEQVSEVFDRMLSEMEALKGLHCYEEYRDAISRLHAGWISRLPTNRA